MLDISVKISGDKVVINGLKRFGDRVPGAVRRGLTASAKDIFSEAQKWLSGPGAKKSNIPGGGYPVPVRTGHLRRSLNWLAPGRTKSVEGETFTAGHLEAVIYNSAAYAEDISEGYGSSRKHGKRPFLHDAFTSFNKGNKLKANIEKEIKKLRL